MQYAVILDGERIYNSKLNRDAMRIISGTVTREINTSGSLQLVIDQENHLYNAPEVLKSKLTVMRWNDSDRAYDCLFSGRPISISLDSYNIKTITCEGYAGLLNDSMLAGYTKSGTLPAILTDLASRHNTATGDSITIRWAYDYDYISSGKFVVSSRCSAMECLRKFCDEFGCLWYPEYTEDGTVTILVCPTISPIQGGTTDGIAYGVNLVSIDTTMDGSDAVTEIYPTGAGGITLQSGTYQITDDVKRQSYRLKSASALEAFGRTICKAVTFGSASTAAELESQAFQYLELHKAVAVDTKIKAYEVGDFDGRGQFEILHTVFFSSPIHAPHNPKRSYLVVKLVNDLCDPSNDTVEVGSTDKLLTKMI